jgi:hypothetical protein
MFGFLKSKKVVVSLVGILAVFVLALAGRDPELVKWVGGFVAGIVSTLNLAQGFADGVSRGTTSSSAARKSGPAAG